MKKFLLPALTPNSFKHLAQNCASIVFLSRTFAAHLMKNSYLKEITVFTELKKSITKRLLIAFCIRIVLIATLSTLVSQRSNSQTKEQVKQMIDHLNVKYKKQNIYLKVYDDGEELEVEFSGSTLTSIPREVFEMKRITSLLIKSDSIFKIQDEIFDLPNLSSLRILYSKIDSVPAKIAKIKTLREIAINYDPNLKYISPALSTLPLIAVQFAYDSMKQIPGWIFNCKGLTSLLMSGNQIKTIPPELGQLLDLTNLEMNFNKIKTIPRVIGKLSKLQRLFMEVNQIEFIPKEVFMLPSLFIVKLSNNKINLDQSEFIKCANPNMEMQLYNNGITSIPAKFNLLQLTKAPKYR